MRSILGAVPLAATQREPWALHPEGGYDSFTEAPGVVKYTRKGELHREDGPAVNYLDGTGMWFVGGQKHRVGAPAVITSEGHQEWWMDGTLHNSEGPAVTSNTTLKEWWVNGFRHRLDGPAIERANGQQVWYQNGRLHRGEGPAMVGRDGTPYWYVYGIEMLPHEAHRLMDELGSILWHDWDHTMALQLHQGGVAPERANEVWALGIQDATRLKSVLLQGMPVEWALAWGGQCDE